MRKSVLVLASTWVAAACGGAPSAAPRVVEPTASASATSTPPGDDRCDDEFGEHASFALDRRRLRDEGASETLLARLDQNAYRYFRMLGRQFARRTCAALRDERWRLPVVAVHGDPHVEQFVVTRETYGLEDFDQAGFGPAVVDLVRYGASLHLACRGATWECDPATSVRAFFDAYRAALDRPPAETHAPSVVARLRHAVPQDQAAWLRWTDSLFRPIATHEDASCRSGLGDFARIQAEVYPDRDARFFDVVRIGSLEMGIGSALERKVLFRVRGPTDAPSDDLLLEARVAAPPQRHDCVWRPSHGASLHALLFMSLLGRRMPTVYGFAQLDGSPQAPGYWVQAWDPGYRELSLSDLTSQAELDELARDAALQLAGHFWSRFPEHLQPLQRRAQLDAFDRTRDRATTLARDLAAESVREWERFRGATDAQSTTPTAARLPSGR